MFFASCAFAKWLAGWLTGWLGWAGWAGCHRGASLPPLFFGILNLSVTVSFINLRAVKRIFQSLQAQHATGRLEWGSWPL